MIIPPFLKPGDRIAIIAPARKISREELQFAVETISSHGFEPVFSENLFDSHHQFSANDDRRLLDINTQLSDPSVKAILCARGGYGCLRITDSIDWNTMIESPKWLIGYSDVTVFHNELFNRGVAAIHGTMPINFHKNPEATNSLFDILKGKLAPIHSPGHLLNIPGTMRGRLMGGNLSLLYALKGTKSFPETKGNILFLEDLDEYLYHIDRMILSLKRAGAFSDLAGIIVGGMTEMKDNVVPFGKTAEEIIHEHAKESGFPVMFNFPAGHIDRNLSFITGAEVTCKVSREGSELAYCDPS